MLAEPVNCRGDHLAAYFGRRGMMADPGAPRGIADLGLRIGRADELRTNFELVRNLPRRVGGPELQVLHAGRDDHSDCQQHGAYGE